MAAKNVLVVYFSRTGNSRRVAEELSRRIGCDIEEIKSSPTYPTGFRGYQKALFHAALKRRPNVHIGKNNLSQYDLVIVGGPVWGSSLSAPLRSFLDTYRGQLKDVAFFLTQGGTFGREKVLQQMKEVCGKSPSAVLSVSERDLRGESYKKRISAFLDELKLTKEPKVNRPPESFASP